MQISRLVSVQQRTIMLFVMQYKNDDTAFQRSSVAFGGLLLKSDVTVILNCKKLSDNFACLKA